MGSNYTIMLFIILLPICFFELCRLFHQKVIFQRRFNNRFLFLEDFVEIKRYIREAQDERKEILKTALEIKSRALKIKEEIANFKDDELIEKNELGEDLRRIKREKEGIIVTYAPKMSEEYKEKIIEGFLFGEDCILFFISKESDYEKQSHFLLNISFYDDSFIYAKNGKSDGGMQADKIYTIYFDDDETFNYKEEPETRRMGLFNHIITRIPFAIDSNKETTIVYYDSVIRHKQKRIPYCIKNRNKILFYKDSNKIEYTILDYPFFTTLSIGLEDKFIFMGEKFISMERTYYPFNITFRAENNI